MWLFLYSLEPGVLSPVLGHILNDLPVHLQAGRESDEVTDNNGDRLAT